MRARLLTLCALLWSLGCGKPATDAGGTFVSMYDNAFNPGVTHIPVGGRVDFLNLGGSIHNVTADDSSWRAVMETGATDIPPHSTLAGGIALFAKPGVYSFHCSYHGTKDGKGMAGVIVVGDAEYHPPTRGAELEPVATASGVTRRVPKDYPTIQSAVDAANPGDLVLIEKGIYKEAVSVTTPSLVLRGVDRNEVIVDGEFVRGNGISVLADAVAIENMTARNNVLNGFFWTGVRGFRGSYLTAYNNGDYGIYAFDASDGLFEYSYASGHPDSGFYIGECYPCKAVIRHVVAENNALGYSGTNAGGELYVVSSTWRHNMAGIVPSSLDIEKNPPQKDAVFAANLVVDNNNRNAPAIPLTSLVFGHGILVAGGVRDIVERNVVLDHQHYGILVTPFYDRNFWRATGNVIHGNWVYRSGLADLALGGPLSWGNQFHHNGYTTAAPAGLEGFHGRGGVRLPYGLDPMPFVGIFSRVSASEHATFPSYKTQAVPPSQPQMPGGATAPVTPAMNVFENLHFDLAAVRLPAEAEQLLAQARTSATAADISRPGFLARLGVRWGFPLILSLGVLWEILALVDLRRRDDLGRGAAIAWSVGVVAVPYLGAVIYHVAGRSRLSRRLRLGTILGGLAVYGTVVYVAVRAYTSWRP